MAHAIDTTRLRSNGELLDNGGDGYEVVPPAFLDPIHLNARRLESSLKASPLLCEATAINLDVGCGTPDGKSPIAGFIGIDRKAGGEAFPLKYNDGSLVASESVSCIRASHVLEHFGHGEVGNVFAEWVRVLKPGGVLKIAVPNFELIAHNYLRGEPFNIQGYTMGGQSDDNDFHKTLFDKEVLADLFRANGLIDLFPWQSEVQDCAALPVSLNLAAVKPRPLPPMKVLGAMSVPRLCFSDMFLCWAAALVPFGISPTVYGGAFWGQCLERVLTEQANSDAEWVLTLDYDSVFTKSHVERLLRLAAEHPEADAIAPLQMSRGRNDSKPLLVIRNEHGAVTTKICSTEFDKPLVKVQTAHFGLTMIRIAALKKMAHPWFVAKPDPQGNWNEGRIDDDIHFWHEWERTGNSLYVAPRVVIGHAELMVTWPDREFNAIHQYPSVFHEKGIPEKVWQ